MPRRHCLHEQEGDAVSVLSARQSSAQTVAVAAQCPRAENVVTELLSDRISAGDVRAQVPAVPGLYAWCANPSILPTLPGTPHPSIPDLRSLYIGIATRLRNRLASNHLGRTGRSTLRRTLAGLLLDDQRHQTRWTHKWSRNRSFARYGRP